MLCVGKWVSHESGAIECQPEGAAACKSFTCLGQTEISRTIENSVEASWFFAIFRQLGAGERCSGTFCMFNITDTRMVVAVPCAHRRNNGVGTDAL